MVGALPMVQKLATPMIIKFLFLVVIVLAVFVTKLLNGAYVSCMNICMEITKTVSV